MVATEQPADGRELLWRTVTRSGRSRFYRWSPRAKRVLPVPRDEAEMLVATGAAVIGERPEWLGTARGSR